jgi:hypothetical protein
MLSWVVIVYPEPRRVRFHSRQTAAHAASFTSSISFNSFTSFSFRTLASHLKADVSPNSLEIKRFRTLCKIPGIGYPPPSILFPTPSCPELPGDLSGEFRPGQNRSFPFFSGPRTTDQESRNAPCLLLTSFFSASSALFCAMGAPQLLCFQSLPDSFYRHGGVYPPPPQNRGPK